MSQSGRSWWIGSVLARWLTSRRPARTLPQSSAVGTSSRLHSSPTETDIQMMERAIALAVKAADLGEVPIGAVIYRNHEIVAEAYNLREASNDPTAHAELIAIRAAGQKLNTWRLNDCSLAVTLEPCPMCAGAMVNARLGRLIYGATDPKAGACETLYTIASDPRLNHRVQVIGGVLSDRCAKLLRDFFEARRTPRGRSGDSQFG